MLVIFVNSDSALKWMGLKNISADYFLCMLRGHPLSTYEKFSEKLTFLTPWYEHVGVRIRGLEMLVFRKILRTYLMDGLLIY